MKNEEAPLNEEGYPMKTYVFKKDGLYVDGIKTEDTPEAISVIVKRTVKAGDLEMAKIIGWV